MFGILRPCRHSLSEDLAEEWMSHMCGLCLALRDEHGQAARIATNYDGLVVSVLTAAQSPAQSGTRPAGRCPLRGMRAADAADGSGAYLAAAVSLMLASAKISDHIEDGDGVYGRRGVRALARQVARRWQRGARESGRRLGFEGGALVAVVDRQREAELSAREGTDVLAVTRPTEEATGEAFAHTAVLAGTPVNAEPLREAGRLFGRVAHLLDAVEDREEDLANQAWNPLTATATPVSRARELCDDAVLGVELALNEAEFTDGRLVRVLLVRELRRAVDRAFAQGAYPGHGGQGHGRHHGLPPEGGLPPGGGRPQGAPYPHDPYGAQYPGGQYSGNQYPGNQYPGGGHPGGGPGNPGPPPGGDGSGHGSGNAAPGDCGGCWCDLPKHHEPPRKRGFLRGCAVALFMTCTCQVCCRDPFPGPWSGRPRSACCTACDSVPSCNDCGNCANCCSRGSSSSGSGSSGGGGSCCDSCCCADG